MKKFVGTVNGKTFDNEKDFNEAAAEAIKSNDGNLSISSYYSYSDETPKEEIEEETHRESVILEKSDYFLPADATPKCYNGVIDYEFPDDLAKKIDDADNKDEIRLSVNGKIGWLSKKVKELGEESKSLQNEIEKLQNELYKKDDELKDALAQKRYYNSIIDVMDGADSGEDCEHKCEKCGKPVEDKCGKQVEHKEMESLFDFLDDLGFWTFGF